MATKGGREKIKLESSAGTGHFYTTSKNKKTTPGKLEFNKFDPVARKQCGTPHVQETALQRRPARERDDHARARAGIHIQED